MNIDAGLKDTEDDRVRRQSAIETEPNPESHGDYLCFLTGTLEGDNGAEENVTLPLRYVPDKYLIKPRMFAAYLAHVPATEDRLLEETAHLILDDLNNQLVARWVQIVLEVQSPNDGVPSHRVLLEDRQPQWDNASLLSRVQSF